MAQSFDFSSIYEDEIWTVKYADATGYDQKFIDLVKSKLEESNFPNLEISIDTYNTGGIIFNTDSVIMLKMKAKKSQFKKFEIYFRAQVFGNVVVYSRLECMQAGMLNVLSGITGKSLYAQVRSKCKNLSQYEEFLAIDNLGNLIFDDAVASLDPNYKERKMLANKS